jgi:hypothetical protein
VVFGGATAAGVPAAPSVAIDTSVTVRQPGGDGVPRRATTTRLSDELGAPVLVIGGIDAAGSRWPRPTGAAAQHLRRSSTSRRGCCAARYSAVHSPTAASW